MKLKRLLFTVGCLAGLIGSSLSWADERPQSIEDLPLLVQEPQHAIAAKRVTTLFTRAHFSKVELDDALSGQIFDRYLEMLDPNRTIFLASDIEQLKQHRHQFDDALTSGKLQVPYQIYQLNLERRFERFEYALRLLEEPMSFDGSDRYVFDRSEAPWPKSVAELDSLWQSRVKSDALNLHLADKEWSEIAEILSKRYTNTLRRLSQTYSEDVFQAIMNAFARSIEPHTSYLSPRNADRFQTEMNLSLEGIGAVLQQEDEMTVVRSLVPGGPADLAGELKALDKITGVAQGKEGKLVDVVGWRLDDVVELIKGPKGSEVRLEIDRGTGSSMKTMEITIVRDKVKLDDRAAESRVYTPEKGPYAGRNVGVIEIPSFYVNLSSDVERELGKLSKENIEAVIIDLRGNGGGALTEATRLTGLFIEQGPVVQIKDATGRISVNSDKDDRIVYQGPVTVLVDRYSASASEIFAAALQDYGRALVVGEQTFGKGTVQQHRGLGRIYDLYDKPLGHVQFTIAKFYRIDGGSTQNRGVIPDIQFPSSVQHEEFGESVQDNALPWDQINRARYGQLGEFDSLLTQLTERHQGRIEQDPEFRYILQDIEEYQAIKDDKSVSLNAAERINERNEREQKQLSRVNDRRQRAGLDKVADVSEAEDTPEADPYLAEAAEITLDRLELLKLADNGQ